MSLGLFACCDFLASKYGMQHLSGQQQPRLVVKLFHEKQAPRILSDWITEPLPSIEGLFMGSFELDKLSVDFLFDRYKKGRLDVEPDYQRSKVWSDKLKLELIDTVFNEWPMGLVMLNVDQRADSDGKPVVFHEVVDGQQRLRSLFEYMDGTEGWAKESGKKGNKLQPFTSLSESDQERFTEYRVSVALMKDFETDEILDVFSRLQNGKPLRIGEKVKALRTPHKPYIRELTEHGLFSVGGSVHKVRAGHWNLAAIFYKGIYSGNPLDRQEYDHLETFLQNSQPFDEKRAQTTVARTKRIMNLERKTIQEAIEGDGQFSNKVTSPRLIKWTFACLSMLDERYLLTGREHLLAKGLRDYQSAREQAETPEWRAYVETGRTGRIDSDDVKVCLEHLKSQMIYAASLQPKDPQRLFPAEQRIQIFDMSGGSCALCGIELSITNFHADHIVPYSQSGKTTLDNGQALCAACNLKKGAA